ncbi:hypothetical protein [Cohnella fermenti]|uniref:ParA family protein n=1 Tax=Cohnella fermenti TaxID=2565925 RepID=A0A4S4BIQ1_9BACL|nr:hypothetical protein [Cohnella fermenti]THF74383.1 hypothetical protein E6C55_25405 [Cohnella fermenti]
MGHSVVFWSPVSGQAGNTSNLAVIAGLLGLEYSARVLLFGHAQSRRAALEQALLPRKPEEARGDDIGIDALARLVRHRKLQPGMIANYTLPLLQHRLDLLPGSDQPDKAWMPSMKTELQPLLEAAKRGYDLVLIDGGNGTGSGWSRQLLQQADVVIVSLNQNRLLLERFFHQQLDSLPNVHRLLVLGQYDAEASQTLKNTARTFALREPLYAVPHRAGLMDALQAGQVLDFLFRNRRVPRDHEHHLFMKRVRELAQAVVAACHLDKPFFGGKEG